MAGWIDIISLLLTIAVFGGTVYGVVYVVRQISDSVKTTKENLKSKGYDISNSGVSIKTSKRFDRGDYIDSTQRSILKAMTATSFNKRSDSVDSSHDAPGLHPTNRTHSSSSTPHSSPTPSASSSAFPRPAVAHRADSTHSVNSTGSGEKKRRGFFKGKSST